MFFVDTLPRKQKPKTRRTVHKWTEEEVGEIKRIFKSFLLIKKTPGEDEIRKGIKISKTKNGFIHKLPIDKIKKKISWLNNRYKHVGE